MKDIPIDGTKRYNYIEFHGETSLLFEKLSFLGVGKTFMFMPGSETHFFKGVDHLGFVNNETNVIEELRIVKNSPLFHFFKQVILHCLFKKVKCT